MTLLQTLTSFACFCAAAIPVFWTLAEVEAESGGKLKRATLRREIRQKRLRAYRARESCNAPLLIKDSDLDEWLETHAAHRVYVPAPSAVAEALKASDAAMQPESNEAADSDGGNDE